MDTHTHTQTNVSQCFATAPGEVTAASVGLCLPTVVRGYGRNKVRSCRLLVGLGVGLSSHKSLMRDNYQ